MNWRRLIGLTRNTGGSTGLGPDFPDSAGDRERGKFRESGYPRLTTIAVSDDEGKPVGATSTELLAELVLEVRLLRQSLILNEVAADLEDSL